MNNENGDDKNQSNTDSEEPTLVYSHNIIEHLGIRLYQNKPTNVLAELVANSWDAYAKKCVIALNNDQEENGFICVYDDGFGIT